MNLDFLIQAVLEGEYWICCTSVSFDKINVEWEKSVSTRNILKPLSQLAHDHFKTLCDPAFWHSHDGSPTLHELSLPLYAIFRSPAVASDF